MSNLFEPSVETFAAESERQRVTPVGIKAYRNLVARWGLEDSDAAALIGFDLGTWLVVKSGSWRGVLNEDQLTRLSALLGIFTALHGLFPDDVSDRWPTMPNKNPIFSGKSPVASMIEHGITRMLEVRRHVEYWAFNGW